MKTNLTGLISILFTVLFFSAVVFSQTTEFTYQGRLLNASVPATGNYDFEFALNDAVSGGAQIGSTLTRSSVAVANGDFSVKLDFGSQFPGANRFIEIRVRQTGGGAYTPLAPRQQVNSAPYSVKAVNADNAVNATNAAQLGGVAANQYVLTGDPRLSDARNPLAGSGNYIQNQNAAPQAASNFNISGNGTAGGLLSGNFVNATTQYNIGGTRILGNPGTLNLFAGAGAGQANTTGNTNSFFGGFAGVACSSSIRYKQNVSPFVSGLSLIKQLRPVSFNWRANNQADLGLVAEDVAAVEPLLTTTNDKGEIEGVKYDRVGVVLVNAVKEQQAQIEAQQKEILEQKHTSEMQQKQIEQQRKQIESLTKIVCATYSTADICRQ